MFPGCLLQKTEKGREWCCSGWGLGRPLYQGPERAADVNPGKSGSSNCFPSSKTKTGKDKQKVWLSSLPVWVCEGRVEAARGRTSGVHVCLLIPAVGWACGQ